MDAQVELMLQAWRGEPVAGLSLPIVPTTEPVPLMFGGMHPKAIERAARWGVGWTMGGGAPEQVGKVVSQLNEAWARAGREGKPRVAALSYFALGPEADEGAQSYLGHYYASLPWGANMWKSIPRTPEAVRERVEGFRSAGIDELLLDPCIAELSQVEELAQAALVRA